MIRLTINNPKNFSNDELTKLMLLVDIEVVKIHDLAAPVVRDTLTKAEIDSFFNFFNNMIQDLEICCSNINVIIAKEKTGENSKIINQFLYHYISLAYSYCAITISKLFIKDEKRSFKKFLNRLEKQKYDKDLNELLFKNNEDFKNGSEGEYDYLFKNKHDIQNEIKKTNVLIDHAADIIEKIKARRDSHYAHYDPDKTSNIEVESLEEIKALLALAYEIYNRYFVGLKNSCFIFNVPTELEELFEKLKKFDLTAGN